MIVRTEDNFLPQAIISSWWYLILHAVYKGQGDQQQQMIIKIVKMKQSDVTLIAITIANLKEKNN